MLVVVAAVAGMTLRVGPVVRAVVAAAMVLMVLG
jgi:hypothetical protein